MNGGASMVVNEWCINGASMVVHQWW